MRPVRGVGCPFAVLVLARGYAWRVPDVVGEVPSCALLGCFVGRSFFCRCVLVRL